MCWFARIDTLHVLFALATTIKPHRVHKIIASTKKDNSITVTVKTLSGEQLFEISGLSTQSGVSEMQERIMHHDWAPKGEQQLFFAGRCLESSNTLMDCGIHTNSVLHLVPSRMAMVSVEVASTDTVAEVIGKITKVPGPSTSRLFRAGRPLPPTSSLQSLEIDSMAELTLDYKSYHVMIGSKRKLPGKAKVVYTFHLRIGCVEGEH
jgi:hypothetical protein